MNSCSGSRTVRTGQGAIRTRRSATLPRSACANRATTVCPHHNQVDGVMLRVVRDRDRGTVVGDDHHRRLELAAVLIGYPLFHLPARGFLEVFLHVPGGIAA